MPLLKCNALSEQDFVLGYGPEIISIITCTNKYIDVCMWDGFCNSLPCIVLDIISF